MAEAATGALGPERSGGQGLDGNQEETGNRAILALLTDPQVAGQVDLVITCRDAAYEVWAGRGMIRFQRVSRNERPAYEIIEQIGENPIADQRHAVVSTCEDELRAAAASGHPTEDANRAFIEPSQLTYPHAYERIAQLFDSPYGPDIVISPRCHTFGLQPGQHGALDVVQSRAPLAFAGPGIRPGLYESAPRHIDIAPTVCRLMGFAKTDGCDWSGRTSTERGVEADVFLKRQDGRVLEEIFAEEDPPCSPPFVRGDEYRDTSIATGKGAGSGSLSSGKRESERSRPPERVYFVIFDGLSNSELQYLIDRADPAIANLRRILDRSARFRYGSTVNFPTITWPSHSTILTGAWCGHHDIVNPTYYDREARRPLAPQAEGMLTERYLGSGVETLYEAFHRALGPETFTANIHEPQGRGADHAVLEGRIVGPRDRLKALTAEYLTEVNPRYRADGHESVHREGILDARGLAQAMVLFDDPTHPPPALVVHEFTLTDGAGHEYGPHGEGLRTAIAESDRRLGRVLDMLEEKDLFETTLFVFTTDHGMAAQDVKLKADPARHPERIGMKTITGAPMVWFRDLDVQVEPAPDGRTARVIVRDNDPDSSGEKPPVEGAEVLVQTAPNAVLARLRTNEAGIAGFAKPADISAADVVIAIHHDDYNPRHLRLDGTNLVGDLRKELYAGLLGG